MLSPSCRWLLVLGVLSMPSLTRAQTIERDIVYSTVGGVELKLDLCRPLELKIPSKDGLGDNPKDGAPKTEEVNNAAKPAPPRPVVVCIHGGAWILGHRSDHHRHIIRLAKEGFVAVSISYRLAPKHPYPAALDDVKAALRFVRSKVKEWNIDPERVAVLGESAGAHLALLTGLMNGVETPGGEPDRATQVRAIVNYCGPTDFTTWRPPFHGQFVLFVAVQRNSADILKAFLGTADVESDIVKAASPITYVAKNSPPVLTLQGTNDALVPDQQARLLHKALDAAGVSNRLELLEGAGHGWGGTLRQKTDRIDVEFLKARLAK